MTVWAQGVWTKPVIGLAGRAQHGKDTVGEALADEWGAVRVSFAAALKHLAYLVNPYVTDEPQRLAPIVDYLGWEDAKRVPEVRRFLQELGTRAREVLGDDVWVNRALAKAEEAHRRGNPVVFTDVRFPNEADAVRRLGGVVVLVVRPGFDNGVDPTHPSEANVEKLGHTFVIVNDGTLDELRDKANHIYTAVELHG